MSDIDREELLVRLAWMHYDDGLTHQQIAQKLRMSRVSVTRLLQRARREGIVQIKITKPLPLQYDLERHLERRFGLRRAIVVRAQNSLDDTLDAIGRAASEHLKEVVFPKCRLGVGWSTTVSRMVPYLEPPAKRVKCVVTELVGSVMGHANPYSISWQIAKALDAPVEPLPVPVVMQSEEARDAILKESAIATVLEHGQQCDVAFVGLGDIGPNSTLVRTGFMTAEQMAEMKQRGAVGDLLMRFFDASACHIPSPLESRVVSLDWSTIRGIPYVVGLAAGPTKVEPLLAALGGRICHCIITDTGTAEQVLSRAPQAHRRP